jgi:hypothetical protein
MPSEPVISASQQVMGLIVGVTRQPLRNGDMIQANLRILEATAKKLGLDPARVVVTVDRHANTSAASVPLALDTAVRDGRVQRGDLLLLVLAFCVEEVHEKVAGLDDMGRALPLRREQRRLNIGDGLNQAGCGSHGFAEGEHSKAL